MVKRGKSFKLGLRMFETVISRNASQQTCPEIDLLFSKSTVYACACNAEIDDLAVVSCRQGCGTRATKCICAGAGVEHIFKSNTLI